jgi:hypothetical protein
MTFEEIRLLMQEMEAELRKPVSYASCSKAFDCA